MKRGWFPVRRDILNDPHWLERPVTRGQAKLDLLGLAEYKATEVVAKGGQKIRVRRGQLFTSYRWLADRWGWHQSRVRRFLAMLAENSEDLYAIEFHAKRTSKWNPNTHPVALGTIITFIHYDVLCDLSLQLPEDMEKRDPF
ncbi:hypothetical protein GH153_06885 [bacterium]|nr:hypothetical protein [bacterium]